MNQPAIAPVVDQAQRRKKRWVMFLVIGAALVVLGAGAVGVFSLVSGLFQSAAVKPWAVLQEAKAAVETESGAATFYRAHPGLADRYPTPAAFVAASRPWPTKLAQLPATVPGFWTMLKSGGGNLQYNKSNSRVTFSLSYRGVATEVVLEDERLVDLRVD